MSSQDAIVKRTLDCYSQFWKNKPEFVKGIDYKAKWSSTSLLDAINKIDNSAMIERKFNAPAGSEGTSTVSAPSSFRVLQWNTLAQGKHRLTTAFIGNV